MNVKKIIGASVSSLLISGLLTLPAGSFAQTTTPANPPGQTQPQAPQKKERHPEIRRAIRALNHAKNDLEKARHDYSGHRVKALELVNQALGELQQALQSDKQ